MNTGSQSISVITDNSAVSCNKKLATVVVDVTSGCCGNDGDILATPDQTHNTLSGLQGGSINERYHLTKFELETAMSGGFATLQSVTANGNLTNQALHITGAEGFNALVDGLSLSVVAGQAIVSNLVGGVVTSSLTLATQSETQTGAVFSTRVAGENAGLSNEFVTLGQVTTGYVPYIGANANLDLGVHSGTFSLVSTGTLNVKGIPDGAYLTNNWDIKAEDGKLKFNILDVRTSFYIDEFTEAGHFEGGVYALMFVRDNGLSTEFLKADGSVDTNTYVTDSSLSGKANLAGGNSFTGEQNILGGAVIRMNNTANTQSVQLVTAHLTSSYSALLPSKVGSHVFAMTSDVTDYIADALAVGQTIAASTSGNAATATKLFTARTINGIAFDGTTNITIPGGASTLAEVLANQYNSVIPQTYSIAIETVDEIELITTDVRVEHTSTSYHIEKIVETELEQIIEAVDVGGTSGARMFMLVFDDQGPQFQSIVSVSGDNRRLSLLNGPLGQESEIEIYGESEIIKLSTRPQSETEDITAFRSVINMESDRMSLTSGVNIGMEGTNIGSSMHLAQNDFQIDVIDGLTSSFTSVSGSTSTGASMSHSLTGTGTFSLKIHSADGLTLGNNNVVKAAIDIAGNITANSFIKQGGLGTEYLMADGSVTTGGGGGTTPSLAQVLAVDNYIPFISEAVAPGMSILRGDGATFADSNIRSSFDFYSNIDLSTTDVALGRTGSLSIVPNSVKLTNSYTAGTDYVSEVALSSSDVEIVFGEPLTDGDYKNTKLLLNNNIAELSYDDEYLNHLSQVVAYDGGVDIVAENELTKSTFIVSAADGFMFGSTNGILVASISTAGIATANSFVKSGGLSTEFLMADGSVSTGGGGGSISLTTTGTGVATLIADVLNIPTPNLALYVPYTGATGNVNLAANTITASEFIGNIAATSVVTDSTHRLVTDVQIGIWNDKIDEDDLDTVLTGYVSNTCYESATYPNPTCMVVLSQAEYDALDPIDPSTVYIIPEVGG